MSILRRYGNGIPGEGKGVYRRRVYVPRAYFSGPQENILRTVTFCGVLSFWCGLYVAFCRECWSFSEIRGFLFIKETKGTEKNEKKCKNDEPGADPGYAADPDRMWW